MAPVRRINTRERNFFLERPHDPGNTLRILYWNIWYDSSPDEIRRAIKEFDCDALFLFEADGRNGLLENIQQLGYGGKFVETNCFGIFRKVQGGIAFFTRLKTGYIRSVELIKTRRGLWRGGADSRRCYLEAKLGIPGKAAIVVGGTHSSYKLPFIGSHTYECERNALLREVEKHHCRYIFGGDLNASRKSKLVTSLYERFNYLETGRPYSWPVRRPIKYLPHHLFDHAVTTHDLAGATARFAEDYSSDHLPLIVEVPLE